MPSATRTFSVVAALATFALSACREASSPVDPLDGEVVLALTPPPPPLSDFNDGGGTGLFCDPNSPPIVYDWAIPLPADPRLIVSGSGSSAMLQLRSKTTGSEQSIISNGAFLQERNGSVVSGRGTFTILPTSSINVALLGDLAQATGTLTRVFNDQRSVSVQVPVRSANGTLPELVCPDNPNVKFRITTAFLNLQY